MPTLRRSVQLTAVTVGFAMISSLAPGAAEAQSAADAAVGKEVRVTLQDGRKTTGVLVSLTASDVVFRGQQTYWQNVTVPLAQVREVEGTSHALAYGAGIGLAAGAVTAIAMCGGGECQDGSMNYTPLEVALFGGIGAGVGAAIGASARSSSKAARTIYRAPAKATVALAPAFGMASMGVAGRISW